MNIADAFFEKFDLLPYEYKHQLDNGISAPTLEDVDAMWELLQSDSSLEDLINKVNRRFYPEYEREKKRREREEYALARQKLLSEKAAQKYRATYIQRTVVNPNYRDPSASDIRLIGEAKAHAMVTKKQAMVVNTTDKYITQTIFNGYETRAERAARIRREETQKLGFDPYAPPDKNKPMVKAGVNKRLNNTF